MQIAALAFALLFQVPQHPADTVIGQDFVIQNDGPQVEMRYGISKPYVSYQGSGTHFRSRHEDERGLYLTQYAMLSYRVVLGEYTYA